MARWSVDLPASLGPRTIVSPGASSMVGVAVAGAGPGGRGCAILTASPRARRAAGGPSRRTSRSSAASRLGGVVARRLEGRDPALDVADEGARDRLGGRQGALASAPAGCGPGRAPAGTRRAAPPRPPSWSRSSSSGRTPIRRTSSTRSGSAMPPEPRRRAPAADSIVAASTSSRSKVVRPTTRSSTVDGLACRRARRASRGAPCRPGPGPRRPAPGRRRRRRSRPAPSRPAPSASARARGSRGRWPRSRPW